MNKRLYEYLKGLPDQGIGVQINVEQVDGKPWVGYLTLASRDFGFDLTVRLVKRTTVKSMKNLVTALREFSNR